MTRILTKRRLAAALISVAAIAGVASPAEAQSAGDFYKGKTVSVYIGYGAGGGYDLYSRLLARHLGKHLAGKPTVIPKNEPGAGSFKLANELYNVMPKDGTALGMIGESLVISQVLGDPAAKFVARDFNWIGRMADSDPVLVTLPGSVATIQEAMTKEVMVGVPGAGSATALNVTAVNGLLGTKFKIISGYEGSAQIRLALERGEVEGSASTLWRIERDWIRERKLNTVYQASIEPAPDLPGVPTLIQLARNDDERKLLNFYSSYTTVGRSIITPPKVPAERVKELRAAFDAAVKDPELLAEAEKAKMELNVMSGEHLTALINEVTSLQGALLERAKKISRADAAN
jgi:tripartite-type tricarboxylate transporter receptor subunit TctC